MSDYTKIPDVDGLPMEKEPAALFDGNSAIINRWDEPIKLQTGTLERERNYNWSFGFVSGLMVSSITVLSFVLFCPVWQEWTNPEPVAPQVTVTEPKVYIQVVPVPSAVINRGNEIPDGPAPPIMPPEEAPAPPPPNPN